MQHLIGTFWENTSSLPVRVPPTSVIYSPNTVPAISIIRHTAYLPTSLGICLAPHDHLPNQSVPHLLICMCMYMIGCYLLTSIYLNVASCNHYNNLPVPCAFLYSTSIIDSIRVVL